MTKIQRVKKLMKWLIFSDYGENETEIASVLGYSKSSLSQILNEKVPLSEKFIDNLCNIDQNINKVWVLNGTGKMLHENILNKNSDMEEIPEPSHNITHLIDLQKGHQESIKMLTERLKESQNQITTLLEILKSK